MPLGGRVWRNDLLAVADQPAIEIPHHVPLSRSRHHRHLPRVGTHRPEAARMAQTAE
jgi:hypothetical protein